MSDSDSLPSDLEAYEEEEKVLKMGFLTKVGGRNKTWKKRWFVLTSSSMKYYKSDKSNAKLQGSIFLRQVRAIRLTEDLRNTPTKFAFEMETPERTYVFCATNEVELQNWVEICQQNLSRHISTTADIIMSGYLTKQGGSIKSWKRRYFVLRNDNLLSYYADEKDSSSLGIIDLQRCLEVRLVPSKNNKEFMFELVTPERVYPVIAGSKEEMESWLHVLLRIVGSALDEAPIDDDEERPSESELKQFLQSDMQTTKDGFLIKQGGKVKSWRKRWFVLRAATLAYYREKGDSNPLGLIPLASCQKIDLASKKESRPNTFEVVTEKRVYIFQAKSQDEMWDWINVLSDALANFDSNNTRIEILALKHAAELAKTKKALQTRILRQKSIKRLQKAKQKKMGKEQIPEVASVESNAHWTQEAESRKRQLTLTRRPSVPTPNPDQAPEELTAEIETMELEIEKLNSMLSSVQPSSYARAIMDYTPNAYDETALKFTAGQILIVEEKDGKGQCFGRVIDLNSNIDDENSGLRGTFPSRYIEEIDDAEFEMLRRSANENNNFPEENWDNQLDDAAKSLFGMYDSDGDGYITQVDFYEFLYEFGKTYLTDSQVEKCWQVMDVEKTGLVNPVNFRKGVQALDDADFFSNYKG